MTSLVGHGVPLGAKARGKNDIKTTLFDFLVSVDQKPTSNACARALHQFRGKKITLRLVVCFQILGKLLQVVGTQRAGGLFQTQIIENVVVTCVVIVTYGLEKLTLCIEHVDGVDRKSTRLNSSH